MRGHDRFFLYISLAAIILTFISDYRKVRIMKKSAYPILAAILSLVMLFVACKLPESTTTTTTSTTTSTTTTTVPSSTAGLVAWYPLDGDGNDASGNGHHLNDGHASYGANRAGNEGTACDFNATRGDYLTALDSTDFDFGTGDFAVAFWFYARANSDAPLVNCYSSGLWGWDIRLDTTLKVYLGGNPTMLTDTGVTPTLNAWHHLALVRDATMVYVFLDGVKTPVGVDTDSVDSTSTLNLGIFPGYAGHTTVDGKLDDVRIYSRALSETEITGFFQAAGATLPSVNLATNLKAEYTLNYTGDLPLDSSGNGVHCTAGGALSMVDRHGTPGGALDFNDAYSINTSPTTAFDFGTGDFSVSFWFYSRETTDVPLVNQYPGAWDIRLGWGGNGAVDKLYAFCGSGSSDEAGNASLLKLASGTVSLNAWHHVLFRRKGGMVDCFLDGVQWVIGSSGDLLDSGQALYFSGFQGYPSMSLNGGLDDVRLYSRALNSAELTALLAE